MRHWLLLAIGMSASGCGAPGIVWPNDGGSGGSASGVATSGAAGSGATTSGGSGSSGASGACLNVPNFSGVCCQSIPTPIPCVGLACDPSICSMKCDTCVGQVCCAKTLHSGGISILCRNYNQTCQ